MRAQRAVLREIADRNLNPKVAYVAGKDGQLKEKKPLIQKPILENVTQVVENISVVETFDVVNEEKEIQAETAAVVETVAVEEIKPKKKTSSKKKEITSTDE